MPERTGFVAILDALGAASYSDTEIRQFLESRRRVLSLLNSKAEAVLGRLDAGRVSTYTFNDTVVIVYEVDEPISVEDTAAFGTVLRHFQVKSLANGILFRGSMSEGKFYSDEATNTIMGRAVSDAAAWYDKADWIGIAATPQATLLIRAREQQAGSDVGHVMIDYPVPMKDHTKLELRAVNWPKGFYVKGLRPITGDEHPRAKCLELLARSGVPRGTETKYFNTVEFFDYCVKKWKDQKKQQQTAGAS
jgi:hypothetical protein